MPENPEKHHVGANTFDPRIQSEDIAFKPDELQACGACGRKNPPTRIKCLYCGVELEIKPDNAASINPTLRKLEAWEKGFNLIFRSTGHGANIAKAADLLLTEASELQAITNADSPLPLARVESEFEANVLIAGLAEFGITCSVVTDAALDADRLPVRLSNIEFRENGIAVTDFNTREITEIATTDLALIIPGLLTTSKVDSLEKKRRGKTKLLDEVATAADEAILDIYSRRDAAGFRVHLAGFDFSCLGPDKGLLAVENMRRLTVKLKEYAPDARLVADYIKVRHALGNIWEIDARKDAQGLQRSGFGKVEFGTTASTSNLRQFTKYSRLQWQLL